ncbi:TonB-dependent outer membrane receptor [Gluconacetobacter sacchari DSM 12717]|uniref:TonB-dependent receptor n=2 Tax=Gluconacetobacter sacchari TaxID=92759 RepID=A0A7W4NP38_9PROT|nr:TonB-dependent receptor [Gluconacetobacter sacchari]MBB2161426.1 TonB-dependent receptor [Gluconacetobacter sacchari]GBQ26161.1 TonB-dependent outer membrane receptor [Gluconacetobacter sacchari DSM 12717]
MQFRYGLLAACILTPVAVTPALANPNDVKPSTSAHGGRRGAVVKATAHRAMPPKVTARAEPPEAVIVTGTHARNVTARQSTSPITVISAAMLQRSGQLNLADGLTRVYPSINVSPMGTNASALTSAIRMRGLNPNEVLVLVDGKRRHTTANISADAGPDFGSTPVDLNMIPAGAIDHIEVLEDGAAALYGSDAIAGVVNIITKKTNHGMSATTQTGANAYNGDGWQYQVGADGGLSLGGDGYMHISGQIYHTDHMIPKAYDHRLLDWAPVGAYTGSNYTGSANPPRDSNHFTSTPEETRENLSINFGKKIASGVQFYGLITYAHRHAEAFENYRTPSTAPSIYPEGFSPILVNEENDYAATLGLKGDNFLGFNWDLSTTYGADQTRIDNQDTVNLGMLSPEGAGCSTSVSSAYYSSRGCGWSPTKVRAETFRMAQWTNNLDFRRQFNIAHAVPMTLAFGAEHRLETYQIKAGEPASYEDGGVSAFNGLQPQSAGNWSRDIWAGYLDGDFHFTPKWDVDFSGRFEHYTDVGNTENGKVATRYNVSRRFSIRGTISNGFRAPTLAEQHYSSMTVGPTGAGGLLSVDSAAAQALGASKLKPERSTNVSAGFVLEPVDGFHVEADVYQINIRDRIVQGGVVNGAMAMNALADSGYLLSSNVLPADVTAYYFTNGASTRTQGLDIKADYLWRMRQYGNLDLSLALDLNRTRLHHNGTYTDPNTGAVAQYLNASNISSITTAYPRSKIILNAYWTNGPWDVNIRQTRYGQTTSMLQYMDWATGTCPDGSPKQFSQTCFGKFVNTPRWLTDIEIGYRITPRWHIAIGANNIFNVRPRRLPDSLNYVGAQLYDYQSAQVPMTGGYYYGRVNLSL